MLALSLLMPILDYVMTCMPDDTDSSGDGIVGE